MRGASGASLEAAMDAFVLVVSRADDALTLAAQLADVAEALDGSGQLRRALTDPSLPDANKQAVVDGAFAAADPRVCDLLRRLAASRWADDEDLTTAVEQLALAAGLADVNRRGVTDTVEQQAYALAAAVSGSPELRDVLHDTSIPVESRAAVIDDLSRETDQAVGMLARHVVRAPRGRAPKVSLTAAADWIATARQQTVASVISAIELSPAQHQRLDALLTRAYGQDIQVFVNVDPAIVAGLRITVNGDVIDSTILSSLAQARQLLAA